MGHTSDKLVSGLLITSLMTSGYSQNIFAKEVEWSDKKTNAYIKGVDVAVQLGTALSPALKNYFTQAPVISGGPQYSGGHFSNIVEGYQLKQRENATTTGIMKAGQVAIVGAMDIATVMAAPTGVGAVAAHTARTGVDLALSYTINSYAAKNDQMAKEILGTALDGYRQSNREKNFEDLAQMSPVDAYHKVWETLAPEVRREMFKDQDAEAKQMLEQRLISEVADNLTGVRLEQLADRKVTNERLVENAQKIQTVQKELTNGLLNYVEKSTVKFAQIEKTQNEMKQDVLNLHSMTKNNEKSISIVANILYSKASPDEQIAMLTSGVVQLPEADKAQAISAIERRKFLEVTVSEYIGYAKDFAQIGQVLGPAIGLDQNAINNINQAVSFASTAQNVAMQAMSGNYIGAIAAATGLFGGGGQDPAAGRHQQLVGMMKQILGKLDVMDQKLDVINQKLDLIDQKLNVVLENQRKILMAIVSVNENIDDLRKELYSQHLKEMAELENIKNHQEVHDYVLNQLSKDDFAHCESFLSKRDQYGYKKQVDGQNRFSSFEKVYDPSDLDKTTGLLSHLEVFYPNLLSCLDGIHNAFKIGEPPSFLLIDLVGNAVEEHRMEKNALKKAVSLFNMLHFKDPFYATSDELNKALKSVALLGITSGSVQNLMRKVEKRSELEFSDEAKATIVEQLKFLKTENLMLSPVALEKTIEEMLQMLPYTELLPALSVTYDQGTKRYTDVSVKAGVLERSSVLQKRNRSYLDVADEYLNISLVQQNLMSGDILLPEIERILFDRKSDPNQSGGFLGEMVYPDLSSEYKTAKEALEVNPVMTENFSRWVVGRLLNPEISLEEGSESWNLVPAYETWRKLVESNPTPEVLRRHLEELRSIFRQARGKKGLNSYADFDIHVVSGERDLKFFLVRNGIAVKLPTIESLTEGKLAISLDQERIINSKLQVYDVKQDYKFDSYDRPEFANIGTKEEKKRRAQYGDIYQLLSVPNVELKSSVGRDL